MLCFKNKFNLLIIVLSFKNLGAGPFKDASVDALRLFAAHIVCCVNKPVPPLVESYAVVSPKPCFLKLKIMINELISFMKQNIHKNATEIYFVTNKIVRNDIFINKPISTI